MPTADFAGMYLTMYFSYAHFTLIMFPAAIGQSLTNRSNKQQPAVNHNFILERRHSLRQKVNTPAFASFDGVTGGMILDLSEDGMAMQALAPVEAHSEIQMNISLGEPAVLLETTGYVAWADALGRAGVRFSDLPDDARKRLRNWLTQNAATRSWKAPRWIVRESGTGAAARVQSRKALSLSLETEPEDVEGVCSTTAQYEFKSLSGDLDAALNLIVGRAWVITRGTGSALALAHQDGMICRATAGSNTPPVGTEVDLSAGLSGECIRQGKPLRCDDTESDPRVDGAACREFGIRSIVAAPILYERETVGLLEVFSAAPQAFDNGDLAVVERLAQTVVLTLSRAEVFQQR
ncbi:MAG TPA: GAF domain-containing protein [Terriglobales bacterium]|nr:GAF domain-containing protein [Terriglobales bacterium]